MRYKNLKRLLSILLVLSLLTGNILIHFPSIVLADDSSTSVVLGTVTDPGTAHTWEDMMGTKQDGNRYAGRVWVDKSVYKHGDTARLNSNGSTYPVSLKSNEDFQVIFSALGSSMTTTTTTSAIGPMDVVLILDDSTSMDDIISGRMTRLEKLIEASNGLLENLLTFPDIRIGIVAYNNNAIEVLSFGKYENGIRLSVLNNKYVFDENNNRDKGGTIQAFDKNDKLLYNNTKGYARGTNVQAGFDMGMNMLQAAENTTGRTPVAILLTDGAANTAATTNFYNISGQSPVQVFKNDDQNKHKIATGVALATLLNAAFNKAEVEAKYNKAPKVYGVGVDLNGNAAANAIINPGAATNGFNASNLSAGIREAYNLYTNTWMKNTNNVVTVTDKNESSNRSYTFTIDHGYTSTGISKQDIADNINYVDTYYEVESAKLDEAFEQIYESLTLEAFNPITSTVTNTGGTGVNNTPLIYVDNIGQYMEIKDIQKVTLFGKTYDVTYSNGNYVIAAGSGTNPTTKEVYNTQEHIKINVIKNADGTQSLRVYIEQQILPILLDEVKAKTEADGTTTSTFKEYVYEPLRLFYTVGLSSDVLDAKGNLDISKIASDYKYMNEENGTISFYSNAFGQMEENTPVNGVVTNGDTHVGFVPSHVNRYYYHQDNKPIYAGVTYDGKALEMDEKEFGAVYHKENAEKYKYDTLTYEDIKAASDLANVTVYTHVSFYSPTNNGGAKEENYIVYTTLEDLLTSIVFGFNDNGTTRYLNYENGKIEVSAEQGNAVEIENMQKYLDAVAAWLRSNSYNVSANELDAYLSVGSLRIPRLHNMKNEKKPNETGTAKMAYAPAYNDKHGEDGDIHEHSEIIVWLGNNGKLTLAIPKTVYGYDAATDRIGTTNIDGKLVKVGDKLYYQIQATNTHTANATINITDKIPAGTELIDGSIQGKIGNANWTSTGTNNNGTISWKFTNVAPNETVYVRFGVTVVQGAVILGKVDNQATVEIPEAQNKYDTNMTTNPVIGKTVTDVSGKENPVVKVGDILTYEIAYFNDKEVALDVTITDIIPAGTTYVKGDAIHTPTLADGILTWVLKDIQPGTGGVVSFEVQVDASVSVTTGIDNNASIQLENNPKVETNKTHTNVLSGDLILTKKVVDTSTDKAFELTLTESTGKLNGTFAVEGGNVSSVAFEDGVAKIAIKHGQTLTVKGLPAGVHITVSEPEPGDGYTPSISVVGAITVTNTAAVKVDVTNTYKAEPVTIILGGTKKYINNDSVVESKTFYFELTEASVGTESDPSAQATELIAEATLNVAGNSETTESFSFVPITYTSAGTYRYTLREVNTQLSGVKYDAAVYTIIVVVKDNEDGRLVVDSISYVKNAGAAQDVTKDANTGVYGVAELVFENSFNVLHEEITLIGKKTFVNSVLVDNQFSFLVKEGNETVATGQSKADGSIVFTTINYNVAGTHIYTIEEVPNSISSILTSTAKYYIKVVVTENTEEAKLEKKVYTGTSADANGTWTEVALKTLTTKENTTIVFENTYIPNDTTVTLKGIKTLIGRNMIADEFDFIVINSATGELVASGSNKAANNGVAGDIVFQPISYKLSDLGTDKTETYTYIVSEVNEGKDNITYSVDTFEVKVTVTYTDNKGWLEPVIEYVDGPIAFENKFKADPIDVNLEIGNKVTTGSNFPEGLTFGYEVIKLYNSNDGTEYGEGVAVGTVVATGISGASGKITLTPMTFYHEGTYKVWLTETYAGQTIHGVKYDGNRYMIVITVTRDGAGKLSASTKYYASAIAGSTKEADYTVEITNPNDETTGVVFKNIYEAKGSLTIEAEKIVSGRVLTANQFGFVLMDEGEQNVLHVATNSENGKIVFDTLNYTDEDLNETFVYIMKEVPGNLPGVDYDLSAYKIVVNPVADDNDNGKIITKYTITQIRDKDGKPITETKITGWPTFENTGKIYQGVSTNVNVTKTLVGRDMKTGEFSFIVKNVKNGETEDSTLVVGAVAGNAVHVTLDVAISAQEGVGTYEFDIMEVNNNLGGVKYDGSVYRLTLVVTDSNKDGILEIDSQTLKQIKDADGKNVDKPVSAGVVPAYVNTYSTGVVDIVLHAQKTLTSKDTNDKLTLDADQFDFEIYEIVNGEEVLRETGSNRVDGDVTFTPITLDKTGTYTYKVVEVITNNVPGVTYDRTSYEVVVVVTDDGNGNLVADVKVEGVSYDASLKGDAAQMQFVNVYDAADTTIKLEGTKVLIGRDMKDGEFTFGVYDQAGNRVAIGTNKEAANGVVAEIDFTEIVFTQKGEYTYTVKEFVSDAPGIAENKQTFKVTVKVVEAGEKLVVEEVVYQDSKIAFENIYTPTPIQVPVQAIKNLIGKELAENEFSFVINENGVKIAEGKNNEAGIVIFDYDLTTDGIQREGILIEAAGTYSYDISEVLGNNSNITYDTTTQSVTIYVTDDGLGNLTADVHYNGKVPTFTNMFTPSPTTVPIVAEKELIGRDIIEDEFTFSVKTLEGKLVAKGYSKVDGTIVFDYDVETDGIQTKGIKFDKVGVYRFAVTEDASSKAGLTMDNAVWYIQIEIVQDEVTGNLKSLHNEVHILEVVNSTATPENGIVFINVYDAKDAEVTLEATKVMTGAHYDVQPGEFEFQIVDANGKVVAIGTNDENGKVVFGKFVFSEAKTYTYSVVEVKGNNKAIKYDESVYKVSINVSDNNGVLEPVVSIKKNNQSVSAIEFKNEYILNPTSVTLNGLKALVGATLKDAQFTFELYEAKNEQFAIDGLQPSATTTNKADGSFSFKLDYEKAGTHYYVVKEQVGIETGLVYDNSQYRIKVEVVDDGQGQLSANVTKYDGDIITITNATVDEVVEKDVFKAGDFNVSIDGKEVNEDDVLTYVIEYVNYSNMDETVVITDKIPTHTTYVEGSASHDGVYKDGQIIWTIHVPAGKPVHVYFDVTVTPDYNGAKYVTFTNQAVVDNGRNEYKTNIVTNTAKTDANLKVEKYQSVGNSELTQNLLTLKAGEILKYTIIVTNNGGETATDVVVTDKIPEGLIYVGNETNGTHKDGVMTWNIDEIKVGESVTLTFEVKVPQVENDTTWVNVATVVYDADPNDDPEEPKEEIPSNPVESETLVPALVIDKAQSVNGGTATTEILKVEIGDKVTYYLTITNTQTHVAENVVVTDKVPAGLIYVEDSAKGGNKVTVADGIITWNLGDMTAGDSKTLEFQVIVPHVKEDTTWTNMAVAVYDNNPENPSTPDEPGTPDDPTNPEEPKKEIPSNEVEIKTFVPAVVVEKLQSVNGGNATKYKLEVKPGEIVTYFIKVTNNGNGEAKNVLVSDTIPTGLILVDKTAEAKDSVITWEIGNLAPGKSAIVSFQVKVPVVDKKTTWENVAVVVYDNNPDNPFDPENPDKPVDPTEIPTNKVELETFVPHVVAEKLQSVNGGEATKDVLKVEKGDKVTYFITITNKGTGVAENVVVTDKVPAGLIFVEGSAKGGNKVSVADGIITWEIGNVAAEASVTVSFEVTVPEVDVATSWVNVASTVYDNNPENPDKPNEPKKEIPSNEVEITEDRIPQTGDTAQIGMWAFLVVASLMLGTGAVVAKKRKTAKK